jgi:hypothetical protein
MAYDSVRRKGNKLKFDSGGNKRRFNSGSACYHSFDGKVLRKIFGPRRESNRRMEKVAK